jgi:acetyl-CoA carboxylase biotin carboxyl carrier protein
MTKTNDSDVAFIKALAEMLTTNDLTELEVMRDYGDNNSLNVRVSRQLPVQQVVQSVAAPVAAAAPAAAAPISAAPAVADPSNDPNAVPSPMVGTAYLSAEPGSASFVTIGDQVSEGQTLMIIEAMKTMNHIPAPKSGTVKRVLVDDGTPVEFGAPLMIIE